MGIGGRRAGRPSSSTWLSGSVDPTPGDYSLEGPLAQVRFAAQYDQATQGVEAYLGHIYMQWQQQTHLDGWPRATA